jgi:hypothetical protein
MAANTLLEMSRSLRLYVPQVPASLAEQFIRDRYRRILDRRDWSALRKEAEFQLNASKEDGTVDVTRGSINVVGTTTTFAATDVGRQFKSGTSPIYTIVTVTDAFNIVLDRAFGGDTATGSTYKIFDGYVTVPSDFLRFDTIADPSQGWQLRHWITSGELNQIDPQRNTFGLPYLIVDRMYSSAGIPQFEAWPYTDAAKTLYYTYIKRADDLIDEDDVPIFPLRSDVIVSGALADVARWPGTSTNPNPYFTRPDYWKSYEMEFEDKMIELERRDEEIYMTMLQQWPYSNCRITPSASWLQSHAI